MYRPLYKLSPLELDEVKRQLDYLLEMDFIEPSQSPFGAPILFVPKKDGGLRMCLDYRWLNKKTIKNRYPLPLPEEMIDRVHGAKYFTKIDLRSGYWQMPLREEDRPKTAFRSRFGHYQFKVLSFGLTNAPAQYMNMVNDIFKDMLDIFVLIFIDDLLIYSKSISEHVEHLAAVLARLQKYSLFAKATKSEICVKETDFCGFWLSEKGISAMDVKVKAIRDWKPLKTVTDVRSFLGMVSFYRRFIPDFAKIAGPLHDLTKKDVMWEWGSAQEQAFQSLKTALMGKPVLIHPNPVKDYTVISDASGEATGGVLCQDHGSGLQPIAFCSRRLSKSEQNYSVYERELLGIAYCLMQWRHYLEGCPGLVTVFTDHQPLTNFMDQKMMSRPQARWLRAGHFLSIKPKIQYIQGKLNLVADALLQVITEMSSKH
ncbi:MAG: hypothetical protein Pyrs2KO_34800 [Pyruvatibacter sp.]